MPIFVPDKDIKMEVVLTRTDNDIVETYWKMLSTLSRTVKLKLASKLTNAVLEEESKEVVPTHYRKARIVRKACTVPTDKELEMRFANLEMPAGPEDDVLWQDVINSNSGKTIKPIEKWL